MSEISGVTDQGESGIQPTLLLQQSEAGLTGKRDSDAQKPDWRINGEPESDGTVSGSSEAASKAKLVREFDIQGTAVPDSPEGYVFTFAEGVEVDEQALSSFREIAFAQGISQQQAEQLTGLYATLINRQEGERQSLLLEAEGQWLKELKQSRNYAGTVASARLAMERFGSPELNELLNETRLGSHPALVKFVARIGQELAEPSFVQAKPGNRGHKLNFYETMAS